MARRRMGLPSWATILAWLGTIGTLLGIIGFFLIDLPNLLNPQPEGLSEENIVATFTALDDEKDQAQLQLTQIALANQQSANQATQDALNQAQVMLQATVNAVWTEQAAFLATQNAIVAASATADAATATADAVGTQAVLDVTATAAAIAQIPPTETPAPTETLLPTETPAPPLVADYRAINTTEARIVQDGRIEFLVQTAEQIPDTEGLGYVWLLDTDRNPATGIAVQDVGVDLRVAARYENGAWIGRVRVVQPDGTLGEPLLFADISISGPRVVATLDPAQLGIPLGFDFVVQSELENQSYSLFPAEGHLSLTQ